MKVRIDKSKCTVCGTCVAICPDVFEMNDQGIVDVKKEYQGKDVPKEFEEKVKEAKDMCPSEAISIE